MDPSIYTLSEVSMPEEEIAHLLAKFWNTWLTANENSLYTLKTKS